MPDVEPGREAESEPTESEAPLNRAERRAQRRGKKPTPPLPGGNGPQTSRRDQVVVPRRSGRRGNR